MHRRTLRIVALIMLAIAGSAATAHAADYVSKGTARLLTHQTMDSLEAHDPQSGRYTDEQRRHRYRDGRYGRPEFCHRYSRRHVDCYFARRVIDRGRPTITHYTGHVRPTPWGWDCKTTNRGPVEAGAGTR